MNRIDNAAIDWALTASEDDILTALGKEVMDGAGRFPASRLLKLGKDWFANHEPELRSRLCGPLRVAIGEDSDGATAVYTAAMLIADFYAADSAITPLTVAYLAALVVRKAAAGFCDGFPLA